MSNARTAPEQNKGLVLEAFEVLFNQRDYAAAEQYWSSALALAAKTTSILQAQVGTWKPHREQFLSSFKSWVCPDSSDSE